MVAPTLIWYAVCGKNQPTKVLATVGVADDLVHAVAYHYSFNDSNLDGKISLSERMWNNQRASWNLHIAYDLARQGVAFDSGMIVSNINDILRSGGEAAVSAAQFANFSILIGPAVNKILVNAGVTGIKKLVYSQIIKSALKEVLR